VPDGTPGTAKQVLMATGRLVVPGLVDMHAHVYPLASAIGLHADELVPRSATTTYVSAGTTVRTNIVGESCQTYWTGSARAMP